MCGTIRDDIVPIIMFSESLLEFSMYRTTPQALASFAITVSRGFMEVFPSFYEISSTLHLQLAYRLY